MSDVVSEEQPEQPARLSRREEFLLQQKGDDENDSSTAPLEEGGDAQPELVPDKHGMFNICFEKHKENITHEEVQELFCKFGTIGKINMTQRVIFVRYTEKEAAEMAISQMKGQLNIGVPRVAQPAPSTPPKQEGRSKAAYTSHLITGNCIYIGNMPLHFGREACLDLLAEFNPIECKFYSKLNKRFAFANFSTLNQAKQAVMSLSGKILEDNKLWCNLVRDKSRVRIIEQGGNRYNQQQQQQQQEQLHSNGGTARHAGNYGHQGHHGLGAGAAGSGGVSSKLQGATDLVFRVDALVAEVLDDCYFCGRIKSLIGELTYVLKDVQDEVAEQSRHQQSQGNGGQRGRGSEHHGQYSQSGHQCYYNQQQQGGYQQQQGSYYQKPRRGGYHQPRGAYTGGRRSEP